jgi:outer membrane protein W
MLKLAFTLPALFCFALPVIPQSDSAMVGIAINMVYTTSAEVFLNPNSSNPEVRNNSTTFEDIWSPALDIRYRFSKEFLLGLNVEYISRTSVEPNLTAFIGSQVFIFEVEDGFRVVPIELTAYYHFPFSTEDFKFMMGGGLGYYIGEFVRKFQDVDLEITQRKFSLGLHVAASMDYMIIENLAARFEMKFRNPQYTVTSKYSKPEVIYQGNVIELPENAFDTKVDIDGLTFILGFVFSF